uniref:CCT domain-containing protein n=1 Tax=Mucochytrium quahogii TaxID=96639 RepID=A0A7S2S3Z3_9STRA|mmetsp:Transcript_24371/g.52833  ORF Transcript_24371/g.52833 Transcript_24371/m.52833 type:complete len:195 (+) Transcript_24371:159-743(+)
MNNITRAQLATLQHTALLTSQTNMGEELGGLLSYPIQQQLLPHHEQRIHETETTKFHQPQWLQEGALNGLTPVMSNGMQDFIVRHSTPIASPLLHNNTLVHPTNYLYPQQTHEKLLIGSTNSKRIGVYTQYSRQILLDRFRKKRKNRVFDRVLYKSKARRPRTSQMRNQDGTRTKAKQLESRPIVMNNGYVPCI